MIPYALKAVRVRCFWYGYMIAKSRNNYMPCFVFYPKIRLLFIENRLLHKIRKSAALGIAAKAAAAVSSTDAEVHMSAKEGRCMAVHIIMRMLEVSNQCFARHRAASASQKTSLAT